jgi:alginate O-acetyltransferase complex protein AlgI
MTSQLLPADHHPIGASYYIFVLLSMIWFLPERLSLRTAARVVFFLPHILAGPISRAQSFHPQLGGRKSLRLHNVLVGTSLFVLGYAKKVLIADPIALSTVPVWNDPNAFSASALLIAIFAFYVQLYADFSGYTDMARGIGRILGYRLPINFRGPYLSATPIEFWRRWHVSLSTWIRLYLYTPLSAQVWRRLRAKWAIRPATFAIVLVVMIVVGLWHEFSLRFLAFGALQGVLIGTWYVALRGRTALAGLAWWTSWAAFQLIFIFSLVVFRAESWAAIIDVFRRLFAWADGIDLEGAWPGLTVVTAVAFLLQWIECHATARGVARWLRLLRHSAPMFPVMVAALGLIMFYKGLTLEGVWVSPNDGFFYSKYIQFIYARF